MASSTTPPVQGWRTTRQKPGRTAGLPAVSASRSLAEQLRGLRNAADLTLEGLAERSGVSVRTLSDIERGVSSAPQRRTVQALADGLRLQPPERAALLREARAQRAVPTHGQRSSAVARHRVPDFTGRERVMAEIAALLAATSTGAPSPVVISGPPGIGKTTSALEAVYRLTPGRGARPRRRPGRTQSDATATSRRGPRVVAPATGRRGHGARHARRGDGSLAVGHS